MAVRAEPSRRSVVFTNKAVLGVSSKMEDEATVSDCFKVATSIEEVKTIAKRKSDELNSRAKFFADLLNIPEIPPDRFEGDFCGDYEETVVVLLNRLKEIRLKLSAKFPEFRFQLDPAAIDKVLDQLVNKEVYICAVGRTNVGKTTVLNTLLHDEILPIFSIAETAVDVYIYPTNVEEPILTNRHSKDDVKKGKDAIRQHLKQLHKDVRNKRMSITDFVLEAKVPVLMGTGVSPRPVLVDTPGCNEVGEKHLQHLAKSSIASGAAFLFFLRCDDLDNQEDYSMLRNVYARYEDLFKNDQVTIVVTHFDQGDMKLEDVREVVIKNLCKEIEGLNVSPDIIIPFSGNWAVHAQRFLKEGDSATLVKVKQYWIAYRGSFPSGEDSSICSQVDTMDVQQVAKSVLQWSKFFALEKRLKKTAQNLASLWSENVLQCCKKYTKQMEEDIKKIESKLKLAKAEVWIRRIQEAYGHIDGMLLPSLEEKKGSMQTATMTTFLAQLEEDYDKDVRCHYENVMKPTLKEATDNMTKRFEEMIKRRGYHPDRFRKDTESFQADLEARHHKHLKELKLGNCPRLPRTFQMFMVRMICDLQNCLRSFGEEVFPSTMDFYNSATAEIENQAKIEELLENVKPDNLQDINVPEIPPLTLWDKFKLFFRVGNVISQDECEEVITRGEQVFKETYYDTVLTERKKVKDHVILYYLKHHCNETCQALEKFENSAENTKMRGELQRLFETKTRVCAEYRLWTGHLQKLVDHLTQQAHAKGVYQSKSSEP